MEVSGTPQEALLPAWRAVVEMRREPGLASAHPGLRRSPLVFQTAVAAEFLLAMSATASFCYLVCFFFFCISGFN